ncbi:hypothetical protein GCM10023174_22170 [Chelativorans composti]
MLRTELQRRVQQPEPRHKGLQRAQGPAQPHTGQRRTERLPEPERLSMVQRRREPLRELPNRARRPRRVPRQEQRSREKMLRREPPQERAPRSREREPHTEQRHTAQRQSMGKLPRREPRHCTDLRRRGWPREPAQPRAAAAPGHGSRNNPRQQPPWPPQELHRKEACFCYSRRPDPA